MARRSVGLRRAAARQSPKLPESERVARRLAAIIGHGGQGAALARELASEGIRTRADLKRPAILARLPRESQSSVLFNPVRSMPLAVASAVAAEVKRRLVFDFTREGDPRPLHFEVIPVGSVRRQASRVKDMDYLVVVPAGLESRVDRVLAAATLRPPRAGDRVEIADTYAAGTRRRSFILRSKSFEALDPVSKRASRQPKASRPQHYLSDLFLTTEENKPYALFHFTGSKSFNIRTRALAKRKGWLLNQYGLFDTTTEQRVRGSSAIRTERDLAKFLGVTYRSPRGRDEPTYARQNRRNARSKTKSKTPRRSAATSK